MGLSWQMAAGAGMVPHPSWAYRASAVEWESVWESIHPARVFPRVMPCTEMQGRKDRV
jgi:hypothetical protein